MAKTRSAVDVILGYCYQFNYTILQLIELENDLDTISIEHIEDVDVESSAETTAIQCKYYSKTEYNHSVISESIRQMLSHFAYCLKNEKSLIKYKLYGYYHSGQEKLPAQITVDFAKSHFLTYVKKGVKYELHNTLKLKNSDLELFLNQLDIDINAQEYEEQERNIISKIQLMLKCSDFEAEHYYYNNALNLILEKSRQPNVEKRSMTKRSFISSITDNKDVLFNYWYIKKRGLDKYCSCIRKKYFTQANISPYERFFLIQCEENISVEDIKMLTVVISKKWAKITSRTTHPYCPYIYFHNLGYSKLKEIKEAVKNDNISFVDGHDFKDANFCLTSICQKVDSHNNIRIKFINEISNINDILANISGVREIYQFFQSKPFFEANNKYHKHIKIQIENSLDIVNII